nr:DUF1972 domain-containing protein [Paenacidovorax monticola]
MLAYDCACLWDARRGYDLVYMLGYGAAWACWWPRVFGVPVWINVDGLEWARSKWGGGARAYLRSMEWVASRVATRVIADAKAIGQRFREVYPKGAPCSYIAYGAELVQDADVDPSLLAAWGLEPYRYMLVVARPEPENHILEIIQGYLLHGGDWPLVVVGNVTGATAYERRLLQLAGEKVRFVGGIYDAQQLKSLRVHAACYLHGHSVGGPIHPCWRRWPAGIGSSRTTIRSTGKWRASRRSTSTPPSSSHSAWTAGSALRTPSAPSAVAMRARWWRSITLGTGLWMPMKR